MADDLFNTSSAPDHCTNPYDAESQPKAHQAYREGWEARGHEQPYDSNPYEARGWTLERAWLNGWQAAHLHHAQRERQS